MSFSSLTRHQPRATLFPYTTLFRSRQMSADAKTRFEGGDWGAVHEASCARISFYDQRVREAVTQVKERFPIAESDYDMWKDRKSTRLNSSHSQISYAVFCLKKKKKK